MTARPKSTTREQRAMTTILGPEASYTKIWGRSPAVSEIIYDHVLRQHPHALNTVLAKECEAIALDTVKLQEVIDACDDKDRQLKGNRYLLDSGRSGMMR